MRQKFRAYLHVLGTDSAKDKPVFGYGIVPSIIVDPSQISSIQIPFDSKWALGVVNDSVSPNSTYYVTPASTIGQPNTRWRKVADLSDGVTDIVVRGDDLYALTYKDASRYEIVRMDVRTPDFNSAQVVVPAGVHGMMDATRQQVYEQLADEMSFLLWQLGAPNFQPHQ